MGAKAVSNLVCILQAMKAVAIRLRLLLESKAPKRGTVNIKGMSKNPKILSPRDLPGLP